MSGLSDIIRAMKIMVPVLGIAMLVLSGCSSELSMQTQAEQICRTAVADTMKDPGSAEFRNVTAEDRGQTTTNYVNADGTKDENVPGNYWRVEGEVNAKNGFGAMVGFRDFTCEAKKSEGRELQTNYVDVDGR